METRNIKGFDNTESTFQGLALYTQQINKALTGTFGTFAALCNIYEIYHAYCNKESNQQRKTKISAHTANLALNIFYILGALLKFVATLILNIVSLAVDLVTLAKSMYIAHRARREVKKSELKLKAKFADYNPRHHEARYHRAEFSSSQQQLDTAREHFFQSKVNIVYTVLSVASSAMLVASCFFPPLLFAALSLFLAAKWAQLVDYRTDFSISRRIAHTFSDTPSRKQIEPTASTEPEEDLDTKILLTSSRKLKKINSEPVIKFKNAGCYSARLFKPEKSFKNLASANELIAEAEAPRYRIN